MKHYFAARHAFAVALLAAALGACSSGGSQGGSPVTPLESVPEGGVPGKVLDSGKVEGSQPPMLRYIVRLDDGRDVTIEEPASRYLGNGDAVYVVNKDGKPYLLKR